MLNTLHWRDDARPGGYRIDEFRTSATVEGKRYGQSQPVIVLTSNTTFSGGEEFAYNLQTRKRATLIGETTGGGAHPGAQFDDALRRAQLELLKTMIAVEKEAPRKAALEARVEALENGKADS